MRPRPEPDAKPTPPPVHGRHLAEEPVGDAALAGEFLPPAASERRAVASEPRQLVARWGLGSVALFAALAAPCVWLMPGLQAASRPLAGPLLLLALMAAAATRLPPRPIVPAATALYLLAALLLVIFAGVLAGNANPPGLGGLGVLCALAGIAGGAPAGLLVAAVSAVALVALGFAPQWLPFVGTLGPDPHAASTVIGLLLVITGLFCGLGLRRLLRAYFAEADDREQRIAGLLALAVDAHWELDDRLRFSAVRDMRGQAQAQAQNLPAGRGMLGRLPWEIKAFGCEPDVLDEMRADLESRAPFRDRPVSWQASFGPARHFLVSGEPRFDSSGRFLGYWGVARETTAQVRVSAELEATEGRYQELFTRIPTPLVLHRHGKVVDANPAAVLMFGHSELGQFVGREIVDSMEAGDSRERARRRFEELENAPPGASLPVTDFRVHLSEARRLTVRAADVRIEFPGGPVTLSIFVDDTERRRAEEAVRRSEALLSHLVATSPDVITLTDLPTGRYAMVNQTFETVTGYSANEVVGRTSAELGIWLDAAERERFVSAVRAKGAVRDMPCHFVSKSGVQLQLLISGAIFAMERSVYLVINGRDITAQERSRLERDAILENASIGIVLTRDERIVLTNPRFDEMLGWPVGSLVGQLGRVVWPDEASYALLGREVMPRLAAGEQIEIERPAQRRDGSSFMARIIGKAVDPKHPAKGGAVWVFEDITEKRQVAEALARARDEAEAANRAKSAFLANTSHELRTPLNGMLGLAQLARDPQLANARRNQYLDQIVENGRALAAILSDVLDFSKIEAGKLQIERSAFELRELLETLRQVYGPMASGRGLSLTIDLQTFGSGYVMGDVLRVRQILNNFLSNALKFTPGGDVLVRVRPLEPAASGDAAQRVRFEVHDSGPGIDEATQARLFRPFTQADDSTTRRFGGTGLGLSICRELATLMGGSVGVDSQLGRGACFWLELPLPDAPAPRGEHPLDESNPLGGLKVLMVEDNAVNMLIGVAMLQRWGAVVGQATDGQEAVQAVQQATDQGAPYDMVLMDIQMPVMSGHEATRRLRAAGHRLPVIALTAAALVTEREQALAAGMDDFLTKPIDADRLRQVLSKWARAAV